MLAFAWPTVFATEMLSHVEFTTVLRQWFTAGEIYHDS
jgi:hypothetical protein